MNFIVTGTPRAATQYTSVLFQALDVPCEHEIVFVPQGSLADAVAWCTHDDGESSWLAWAFLGMLPEPVVVFHQRRDPWKVIDSLAHRNIVVQSKVTQTQHFLWLKAIIELHCPRLCKYESTVNRAAVLLLDWNAAIERVAASSADYFAYHVEDLTVSLVQSMLERIGVVRSESVIADALESVSTETNVGLAKNYDATITDPHIIEYMEAHHPGRDYAMQSIDPVRQRANPEELAEQMDPELLEQVNAYAVTHGYQAIEQLVAA